MAIMHANAVMEKHQMEAAMHAANAAETKHYEKKKPDDSESEDDKREEASSDDEKRGEKRKEGVLKESAGDDTDKKKDEEKVVQKVQDKSKPVSSTPVPGTPWLVSSRWEFLLMYRFLMKIIHF